MLFAIRAGSDAGKGLAPSSGPADAPSPLRLLLRDLYDASERFLVIGGHGQGTSLGSARQAA